MEIEFIDRSNSSRIILIFTGWSTGPELFVGLKIKGWDIAVIYDYESMHLDCSFLHSYSTVYLFAWSMGVAIADAMMPADRVTAAFAVNGTISPVSDDYGIPRDIFYGTAQGLNVRNLQKFRKRMMPNGETYQKIFGLASPTDSDIEKLRRELMSLYTAFDKELSESVSQNLHWHTAYIGHNDRIFPPQNMLRAWKADEKVKIIESDDAHFMDIAKIIRSNVPDVSKISERFTKAMDTYDSYAISQQIIASHLARLIRRHLPASIDKVIEIGPGTGYLSRLVSDFVIPQETYYVDIVKTSGLPLGIEQHYIQADAEEWINSFTREADMIMSASCIQWFADIPGFLHNCRRRLRKGGLLAISTFVPGNLGELDELRPSPLKYPSIDMLKSALKDGYEILELTAQGIRMEFADRRQLLMHIKHTGVAGGKNAATQAATPLSRFTGSALTYFPVYLIAKAK